MLITKNIILIKVSDFSKKEISILFVKDNVKYHLHRILIIKNGRERKRSGHVLPNHT